jgi:hypothetical protein
MIGERGACHLKQPPSDHLRRASIIDSNHCFEKDARRQILSVFVIPNPAIDIVIDRTQILLIHLLQSLHIWSVPFCCGTRGFRMVSAQCRHDILLLKLNPGDETDPTTSYYVVVLHPCYRYN